MSTTDTASTSSHDTPDRHEERGHRPDTVPDRHATAAVYDERPAPQRAAASLGNRNFGRMLSRMRDGDGILPSGLVHPDVQATIAASRGTGRPLTGSVSRHLETSYGEPLPDVRVHTDERAADLARAVSARAFTVGSDIFFARDEYNPATRGGQELIAHEVAHVVQQRGAPPAGQLRVSQPGDATEREAEEMARDATN